MLLLAIDTCGPLGGVALGPVPGISSENGQWFRELAGRTYSELLLVTISELLAEAGVGMDRLAAVAVVHGPGSFTGIRIGVSAAKGLAEGLGIPLMAISRLELLARKAANSSAVAVLDAGRGDFFAGVYRDGIREMEALLSSDQLRLMAADAGLPVLVCEERTSAELVELDPQMVPAPTAIELLAVGVERFRAGAFDDVATLDANYLRRSESEMLAKIAEHAAVRAARLHEHG